MLSLKDFEKKAIVFIFSGEDKIRFANENLVVDDAKENKIKHQIPCIKVFAVYVIGSITLTSVILEKASEYGFSIIFLKMNFRPVAFMGAVTEGNTILRTKQYKSTINPLLSRQIVQLKIQNQLMNLKNIRDKNEKIKNSIQRLKEIINDLYGVNGEDNAMLLGMEGNASKIYFSAYFEDIGWNSRKPRAKIDPINTLMDIGYTFLFNFVEAQLKLYGFDLYYGFYHRTFYQRKSLVCDMVEPFRFIVDKTIRNGFHLHEFELDDFESKNKQYYIQIQKNKKYTKKFFEALLENKIEIFNFIREYYRFIMQNKPMTDFPVIKWE